MPSAFVYGIVILWLLTSVISFFSDGGTESFLFYAAVGPISLLKAAGARVKRWMLSNNRIRRWEKPLPKGSESAMERHKKAINSFNEIESYMRRRPYEDELTAKTRLIRGLSLQDRDPGNLMRKRTFPVIEDQEILVLGWFLHEANKDRTLRSAVLECNHPDKVVGIASELGFKFSAEALVGQSPEYRDYYGPWKALGSVREPFMGSWGTNGFFDNFYQEYFDCCAAIRGYYNKSESEIDQLESLVNLGRYEEIAELVSDKEIIYSAECVKRAINRRLSY